MPQNLDHRVLSELGKEHALSILEILFIRGPRTASEVARELDIHISTSQAYLESLQNFGVLGCGPREGRKGLVEYSLVNPNLIITIDLAKILDAKAKVARGKAAVYMIRERAGAKISYEWNEPERKILKINFMERSKALGRLNIARSIQLSEVEGRFLWALPQSTEARSSVLEVAHKARVDGPLDLIPIIELVEMLSREKVLELTEADLVEPKGRPQDSAKNVTRR